MSAITVVATMQARAEVYKYAEETISGIPAVFVLSTLITILRTALTQDPTWGVVNPHYATQTASHDINPKETPRTLGFGETDQAQA
jgi:hypothetical protein